jgi:hypothetical protein
MFFILAMSVNAVECNVNGAGNKILYYKLGDNAKSMSGHAQDPDSHDGAPAENQYGDWIACDFVQFSGIGEVPGDVHFTQLTEDHDNPGNPNVINNHLAAASQGGVNNFQAIDYYVPLRAECTDGNFLHVEDIAVIQKMVDDGLTWEQGCEQASQYGGSKDYDTTAFAVISGENPGNPGIPLTYNGMIIPKTVNGGLISQNHVGTTWLICFLCSGTPPDGQVPEFSMMGIILALLTITTISIIFIIKKQRGVNK